MAWHGQGSNSAGASRIEKLMHSPKRIQPRCVIGAEQDILAIEFPHWSAAGFQDFPNPMCLVKLCLTLQTRGATLLKNVT
jgi:hypothetical protein